jgi:hypothetical protein
MQVTKGPLFDDASVRLFEIWQVEGSFHDDELQLESDLLSENGLDLNEEWLVDVFPPPLVDLVHYNSLEIQPQEHTKKRSRTCCNFLHYPPGRISLDKVRRIVPYGKGVFDENESPSKRRKIDDHIPSVEDLELPSLEKSNKDDPVAAALQDQLQDLLTKFKNSYASLMDTKKQLDVEDRMGDKRIECTAA